MVYISLTGAKPWFKSVYYVLGSSTLSWFFASIFISKNNNKKYSPMLRANKNRGFLMLRANKKQGVSLFFYFFCFFFLF